MSETTKIIPLKDLKRGFSHWRIDQIYTGDDGTGRIVPNVGDVVYVPEGPSFLEVTKVDGYFSELSNPLELNRTGVSATDGMIGTGGGHVSETYRLNVNSNPEIPECSFDARLRVYDDQATHLKLFLGNDTSVNGTVISAVYNNSGQFVSENIPFGPAFAGADGVNIKIPKSGHLTRPLTRGTRVTAVIYKNGEPRSECRLITRDTGNIRPYTGLNRIVKSIGLKSIWSSPDEENTLIVPVNLPTGDVRATCVVTYIDGGTREYEIDGVRAALHGLTNYSSNSPGERKPLTLSYYPTDTEEVQGGGVGIQRHKSVPAWMRSAPADGAYSVKLFVCPEWMGAANGYRLRYYLVNMDGDLMVDATAYVYSADGSTFNPHGYGVTQNLSVRLDVGAAIAVGNAYQHKQDFSITLVTNPTASESPWELSYTAVDKHGAGLVARLSATGTGQSQVNLRSGAMSLDEWLNMFYYKLVPLNSAIDGTLARKPTHVELIFDGYTERHPVESWSGQMVLDNRSNPVKGDTLIMRFIKVTPTLDITLGVASVNVWA